MAGLRKGLHGEFFPTAVAAGAKARKTKARAVVVENVPSFPLSVAQGCYGQNYAWIQQHQDPAMVGFDFVARRRTFASEQIKHVGAWFVYIVIGPQDNFIS